MSCDGGERQQSRAVLVAPANGGAPCPELVRHETCNTHACPATLVPTFAVMGVSDAALPAPLLRNVADVVASYLSIPADAVQAPSAQGAPGGVSLSMQVTIPATQAPFVVQQLSEPGLLAAIEYALREARPQSVATISTGAQDVTAPVDCQVSAWDEWGPCPVACGGGEQLRFRSVITPQQGNGAACPALSEARSCNVQACPVDCVLDEWSEWTLCAAACGGGLQVRERAVLQPPLGGGQACGRLSEERSCNAAPCDSTPSPCQLTSWSPWSECSAACGEGVRQRTRQVLLPGPPSGSGACGPLVETQPCNTGACPQDCRAAWGEWGACTATCGGGERQQVMHIVQPATGTGKACGSDVVRTESCNTIPCSSGLQDRDCTVSGWTAWSECTAACQSGVRMRMRSVVTAQQGGGATCPALLEVLPCNTQPCPVDCALSGWSEWSQCSAACEGGSQFRERAILVAPRGDGQSCLSSWEARACNLHDCDVAPAPCAVSAWSTWTECSTPCGGGVSRRSRQVLSPGPASGPGSCPHLVEERVCNSNDCPQQCILSTWRDASSCSASCGGGMRVQVRDVLQQPIAGGTPCGELLRTVPCNTQPCTGTTGRDCVVSHWEPWSDCSASCGGGQRVRTRSILVPQQGTGHVCPALFEVAPCNTQSCPQDCLLADWSEWSSCSATCGGGLQHRERAVLLPPRGAGQQCGTVLQSRSCSTQACSGAEPAVSCVLSAWSEFGACTAACGGGLQFRTRLAVTPQQGAGAACGSMVESRTCNVGVCPRDCRLSEWSDFSTCSVSCGGGVQRRTREVVVMPIGGGQPCGDMVQERACNDRVCGSFNADCMVSDWGTWSACSASCGGGSQVRFRTIVTPAAGNGTSCPALMQARACNTPTCPVHCQVAGWSDWGACSQQCGQGVQVRSQAVAVYPLFGGQRCPDLFEQRACSAGECTGTEPTMDCLTTSWSPWTECSASCGGGMQIRTRQVVVAESGAGAPCGELVQARPCNQDVSCPVPCVVSDWSDWSSCSALCGGGLQVRLRDVLVRPENGGQSCPDTVQTRQCNIGPCAVGTPVQNCTASSWESWSECSEACGGGVMHRKRDIVTPATPGGTQCTTLESRACNTPRCPVPCAVGPWSEYGACSAQCSGGERVRTRPVTVAPLHGGQPCPVLVDSAACNTAACTGGTPQDCVLGPWSDYSECSAACGSSGRRSRTRAVVVPAANGGAVCGPMVESHPCNTQDCPQGCHVSAWSEWSGCSATCGGGKQGRMRFVLSEPQHGGQTCGALFEERDCNAQTCAAGTLAVDCVVSQWSSWSECDSSCGGGEQVRTRSVVVPRSGTGEACAALRDTRACNTHGCPVDCVLSPWSEFSPCSAACGGGTRSQFRVVQTYPMNGGAQCDSTLRAMPCNNHECPVANVTHADCEVSPWGSWEACSASCGGGVQARRRSVTKPATGAGTCVHLTEERECNTGLCPVNCQTSEWSEWSPCSVACGTGVQARTRSILRNPMYGGQPCGNLVQAQECQGTDCAAADADCVLSPWGDWSECTRSCGGGERLRTRSVLSAASGGGAACGHTTEVQECNTQGCPVACEVGPWSSWSSCSRTCGGGSRSRQRAVMVPPQNGGQSCPPLDESMTCNEAACGPLVRAHVVVNVNMTDDQLAVLHHGIAMCLDVERDKVTLQPPMNTHAGVRVGYMVQFLAPATVDEAVQLATLAACGTLPAALSTSGATLLATSTPQLHTGPDDRNCTVSAWSAWSVCSRTCGGGSQSRFREVLAPASGSGMCFDLLEERSCQAQPCPVDCQVSAWSAYGACSTLCGGGEQESTRTVLVHPTAGGQPCDALQRTRECNTQPCPVPVHCVLSTWTPWSSCSAECDGGIRNRSRTIVVHPQNGGTQCGSTYQAEPCNTGACMHGVTAQLELNGLRLGQASSRAAVQALKEVFAELLGVPVSDVVLPVMEQGSSPSSTLVAVYVSLPASEVNAAVQLLQDVLANGQLNDIMRGKDELQDVESVNLKGEVGARKGGSSPDDADVIADQRALPDDKVTSKGTAVRTMCCHSCRSLTPRQILTPCWSPLRPEALQCLSAPPASLLACAGRGRAAPRLRASRCREGTQCDPESFCANARSRLAGPTQTAITKAMFKRDSESASRRP